MSGDPGTVNRDSFTNAPLRFSRDAIVLPVLRANSPRARTRISFPRAPAEGGSVSVKSSNVLIVLAAGAGVAASTLLLRAGLVSMAARLPLSLLIAWATFVGLAMLRLRGQPPRPLIRRSALPVLASAALLAGLGWWLQSEHPEASTIVDVMLVDRPDRVVVDNSRIRVDPRWRVFFPSVAFWPGRCFPTQGGWGEVGK